MKLPAGWNHPSEPPCDFRSVWIALRDGSVIAGVHLTIQDVSMWRDSDLAFSVFTDAQIIGWHEVQKPVHPFKTQQAVQEKGDG